MINYFFDYYIQEQTWTEFMLEIHKLGFRSEMHRYQMKKMFNKRPVNVTFSVDNNIVKISNIFSNSDDVVSEMNHMELGY